MKRIHIKFWAKYLTYNETGLLLKTACIRKNMYSDSSSSDGGLFESSLSELSSDLNEAEKKDILEEDLIRIKK